MFWLEDSIVSVFMQGKVTLKCRTDKEKTVFLSENIYFGTLSGGLSHCGRIDSDDGNAKNN